MINWAYTVWFGPTAPEGHEDNWIQTMPGKSYNVLLPFYGPPEPWFDKTWKPGDFELVEWINPLAILNNQCETKIV